jgi:hypothetical protein
MRPNRVVLPQDVVSRPSSADEHTNRLGVAARVVRWVVLGFVVALSGCEGSAPIREYTVSKPPAPKKAPVPERAPRTPEAPSPPSRTDPATDRILGAILPQGDVTWFVKGRQEVISRLPGVPQPAVQQTGIARCETA